MKTAATLIALLSGFLTACHLRARSKVEEKVAFRDNLNYSATGDKDAGFDLYLPKIAGAQPGGKFPAVVFIHGGYWRNQTRSYYQAFTGLYQNFGLALATRGIATAVIDYRLYPRAKPEDQIADVESAVAFLKQHAAEYGIDPARIFTVGHSAGGHLALMALWQKKNANIRAAIALSPILDIAQMRRHKEPDFNIELTVPFFGSGDADAKYSPATYAVAASAPALILFGDKDYAYLVEQGKVYKDKFAMAGLRQIRIETLPETDHSSMVMDVHTSEDKVSDVIARYIADSGGT